MKRIKRRIYSGAVCEQEVFTISDGTRNLKKVEPRQRFSTDAEREQHRLGISRRNHTRLFNSNFAPSSLYSTLTFDSKNKCEDYKELKRIRDLFVRRLKYACPTAVIFLYIGQGKRTKRYHLHMVSEGIPAKIIAAKWSYGRVVRIEHLRKHNFYNGVDHGQDYSGLATYLFNHWSIEQGNHRWKMTRNARRPMRENPTVAKRKYTIDKPPHAPKGYKLVKTKSTKYGYLNFTYVLICDYDCDCGRMWNDTG